MPPQSDKKKKTKQNHSRCGHPSVCNSCSCPFSLASAATSSFLSSSSEHQASRFIFFWPKFHLEQNGQIPGAERKLRAALPALDTRTPSPQASPRHRACRGARGAAGTSWIGDGARSKSHVLFQGQLSELPASTAQAGSISGDRRAEGLARGSRTRGRFAFQNYPSSGAAPYLPFPSAPGDTIPFLHQLGVFGSKGNLVPPR